MSQPEKSIRYYRYPDLYNIGDTLAKPILEHFLGPDLIQVDETQSGKLVSVGSVMSKVKEGDIVWGTGCMHGRIMKIKATFLAVRGELSRAYIRGSKVPEVYGDPALLLPLMYHPDIKKTKKVGYVPHYVDKHLFKGKEFIDVNQEWKSFVDKVLECEHIISSSLHGIVIAEAYGIPATWAVYSDKVIGNGFKFRDYLTGTGRTIQGPGKFPPIPNLKKIQKKLVNALLTYYGKDVKGI